MFRIFFVLNSNLEGNNMTLINNTQSDKASNTEFQKPASEIQRCNHLQREQVEVQVLTNKTVCRRSQNCTVFLVTRNATKTFNSRSNICWDVTYKLRPLLFVLGTGAILSNLVVFTTVMRAKSLRKRSPFLLVSEMTFCDLLVGIYSVGMAFGHGHDFDEFKTWKRSYCPLFRNLFIVAEVVGSLTSLLMTIERYMAVVFCMRPNVRLGRKAMATSLVLFWIAGATAAALVQILDAKDNQKIGQMCLIYRNRSLISTVFVSELLLLFLVLFYFVVVVLYVHIFIVVRKSARNLGVQRESRLAKRISVIVLTSFVFFAAPNFSLAWFIFWGGNVFDDARFNRTLLWWLPPVCLVVNSCLNPCLFAFKNDKFVKALRKKRGCPLGDLFRSKSKAKNDQAYDVFSKVDSALTTSQCCLPSQGVALTMFSAVEEQREGIRNDALELHICQA